MRTELGGLLAEASSYVDVTACMLCGSPERTDHVTDGQFRVVRCSRCGLGYVTPRLRPEVLPRVYDDGYWASDSPKDRGYGDYREAAPLYLKTFEKRYQVVAAHAGAGEARRALDIGCAAGYFLKVMRDHGWQVDGVELSAEIAAHGIDEYGLDVHVGELADAPFNPETFDLITMWDLIEHVPEPLPMLQHVVKLLKPGGIVIIETQNLDSVFARVLGGRWQHYKHLEHLYHFNPSTITRLLADAGLRVKHLTPRYGGKHVSVAFVRERAQRVHPVARTVLRPLRPLDGVDFYVNFRDEMIVVAGKA